MPVMVLILFDGGLLPIKKKKKKDISRDTMQSTILTDILKKKIHHKEKKTVLGYVSGFFCIFVQ